MKAMGAKGTVIETAYSARAYWGGQPGQAGKAICAGLTLLS
jgi:hypothetical protein